MQGANFGILWLDVEPCDECWNDFASNMQFVAQCVQTAEAQEFTVGICSSNWCWANTVGEEAAESSITSLPLWYADHNVEENFEDVWACQFGGGRSRRFTSIRIRGRFVG